MVRRLTDEWSIELDASFRSRVVDEDLQLVSVGPPVRTVWVAVWSPPPALPVEQVLATVRQEVHPGPAERFEEQGADPGEGRYASWYREGADGGGHQWGLYAYTVRRGSYVQAAFLVDDPSDQAWALAAWRSLTYTGAPA